MSFPRARGVRLVVDVCPRTEPLREHVSATTLDATVLSAPCREVGVTKADLSLRYTFAVAATGLAVLIDARARDVACTVLLVYPDRHALSVEVREPALNAFRRRAPLPQGRIAEKDRRGAAGLAIACARAIRINAAA